MIEVEKIDIWDAMNNFRMQTFGRWPIVLTILFVFQIILYLFWILFLLLAPRFFKWLLIGVMVIPVMLGYLLYGLLILSVIAFGLRLFLAFFGVGHI